MVSASWSPRWGSVSHPGHVSVGPNQHGGWSGDDGSALGNVHFNSKTSEFYRQQIELPFFEFHLKGKGENKHPKAWVFETGTNQWRKHDAWPPKGAKEKPNRLVICSTASLVTWPWWAE